MISTYSDPISQAIKSQIRSLSEADHPVEACGFILQDNTVVKCTNTSSKPDTFVISAEETALYLDDAVASWHSHADYNDVSFADVNASKALNLPYLIFNCATTQFFYFNPSQGTGLLGRPWMYGGYDCYSAVRDWYSQQMGVQMADYERLYEGEWSKHGFTHFERNFASEGFVKIPRTVPLQRGDVLMMRIRNNYTCNHVAVLEDPSANLIFQHLVNRKSELMSYTDYFRNNTHIVVRRGA